MCIEIYNIILRYEFIRINFCYDIHKKSDHEILDMNFPLQYIMCIFNIMTKKIIIIQFLLL